jgi:tRNA (guanine26-N2/guanine27-N2)-dimethyltransferase
LRPDPDLDLVERVEGRTRLLVPAASLGGGPPPKSPAFFNPLAAVTRDFAVLFYGARYRGSSARLLDALCGVGARGIRVANESGADILVHLNDANPTAAGIARRNCDLNGLGDRCTVSSEDANALMYGSPRSGPRFDAIDVDPFGSPVPFVDAAVSTVRPGGIVALTATDLSALTGRSRSSGRRKYFLSLHPTDFSREVAARALAAYGVIRAAAAERGARPVFAHVDSQYLRVYLEIRGHARAADESLDRLGHLGYCPRCLYRGVMDPGRGHRCPVCGGELLELGPLWLGDLFDGQQLRGMLAMSDGMGWAARSKLLGRALADAGLPPYYYALDRIADSLGTCVPRLDRLLESLASKGYRAVRSWAHELGVKTDAPHQLFMEEVRRLSSCRGAASPAPPRRARCSGACSPSASPRGPPRTISSPSPGSRPARRPGTP